MAKRLARKGRAKSRGIIAGGSSPLSLRDNRLFSYNQAMTIAQWLKGELAPVCNRVEIVGSLRRKLPMVGDVEILVIPQDDHRLDAKIKGLMAQGLLDYRRNVRGSVTYGPLNKFLVHKPTGIPVDVFSTTPENWWVSLVVRTGPAEGNMAIARAAIRKGWRLKSYGSGFVDDRGNLVRCYSERDVFELVGLEYKPPERR